jgi:hypothetical protein
MNSSCDIVSAAESIICPTLSRSSSSADFCRPDGTVAMFGFLLGLLLAIKFTVIVKQYQIILLR